MESKYKLKTTIVVNEHNFTVSDIQSGSSDKQARFMFYQRIKHCFEIEDITFAKKVQCDLIKKDIKIPIIDLAFKNFKVEGYE